MTIQINSRGVLTLPAAIRRASGLMKGGVVMAEISNGAIVLRPAVAFPIEMYSDERVAEFDKADAELQAALHKRKVKR